MEEFYEKEAFDIVNNAISQAIQNLSLEKRFRILSTESEKSEPVLDIDWVSCENFTGQTGVEQILLFVSTWKRDSAWLHCIDYLGVEDLEYDYNHKYRVCWSIPTRRKPVPRATANVYFSIYVSKIKPEKFPVQVFYVFEGNRLIHRPGKSRFREIWLKNIIESKVKAMETINF